MVIIIKNMIFTYLECNPIYICPAPQNLCLPFPAQQDHSPHIKVENCISEYENVKIEQQQGKQKIILNLDDLQQAGYQKKKSPWTPEEDDKLMRLVRKQLTWSNISREMNGRNLKMCYSRYKRIMKMEQNPKLTRYWSKQDDEKLVQLIEKYGEDWKYITTKFQNKKPKQLRERYINTLAPNITNQPWTQAQDLQIIELYNVRGKKWKSIAEEMKNRSENQVKNRFYGRLLPLNKMKIDTVK